MSQLIGRTVRRVHPSIYTEETQVIQGHEYTIIKVSTRKPIRIALKESGENFWALLDAFDLLENKLIGE